MEVPYSAGPTTKALPDATAASLSRAGGRQCSENAGVTTVEVVLDSEDDFAAMFDEALPVALAKLKEVAEERR